MKNKYKILIRVSTMENSHALTESFESEKEAKLAIYNCNKEKYI